MFGLRFLAAAAFVAAASAQLTITDPGPSAWWVAASYNTIAWTCDTAPSSYSSYTVVLSNSNTAVLEAPLALIASVPNYDCSFQVSPQQSSQMVATGYTLALANPLNQSDWYATAQFEIKASGSPYPATTSSASGTATSSGASASSTAGSKSSGAVAHYVPVGMSMAAALVLGLVVA